MSFVMKFPSFNVLLKDKKELKTVLCTFQLNGFVEKYQVAEVIPGESGGRGKK